MTHDSRTHRRSALPGFSLVEILIAILILGLGLLGLGAVFPAVIAQQRGAVEKTQAAAVAATAAATLRGGGELANWSVLSGDKFFSKDQNYFMGMPVGGLRPTSFWDAEWRYPDPDQMVPNNSTGSHLAAYRADGEIRFGGLSPTDPAFPMQLIPELARLSPPAFSGRNPKYVWDMVARRHPSTEQIEVALFIRKVDSRIRASGGVSLSEMIAQDNVYAVAVDKDTGLSVAGDHPNAEYAVPLALAMEIPLDGNEPIRDRIHFLKDFSLNGEPAFASDPMFEPRVELASQVGQKLVDNFGVVRTVVRVVEDETDTVVIQPPFTRQQAFGGFSTGNGGGAVGVNTIDPVLAQQVVFTPQIPVSVEVFRVE